MRPSERLERARERDDTSQRQQLFEGRVLNTPGSAADDVFVKIPAFDDGKHKFPVVWRPVIAIVEGEPVEVMPSKNDFCLVAKPSITGSVWLLSWR